MAQPPGCQTQLRRLKYLLDKSNRSDRMFYKGVQLTGIGLPGFGHPEPSPVVSWRCRACRVFLRSGSVMFVLFLQLVQETHVTLYALCHMAWFPPKYGAFFMSIYRLCSDINKLCMSLSLILQGFFAMWHNAYCVTWMHRRFCAYVHMIIGRTSIAVFVRMFICNILVKNSKDKVKLCTMLCFIKISTCAIGPHSNACR